MLEMLRNNESWKKAVVARNAARRAATSPQKASAAVGHLQRWEFWSGAQRKRVAAQAEGKTYLAYLRQGEAVAAARTTRPMPEGTPSPTTSSYISQGDSLRDMVAKDAPRTLLARDNELALTVAEKAHIESVTRVLTALFGGRLSASQYRQGISIVVAFLLTVARSAAVAQNRDAVGPAQRERDESTAFWLISAVVEDIYPLALDSQLLLGETMLTWQLLRQRFPAVVAHLAELFGDAEAAEAGFTGLFVTKFLQTLCADQFPHETACQIWDVLLVSHYSSAHDEDLEPEPEPEQQPEQQAPHPYSAVYQCVSRTSIGSSMYGDAKGKTVLTVEADSVVEVVERCTVVSLGCVRLRVCAVARATKDGFVYEYCGGWITAPGSESSDLNSSGLQLQEACFVPVEREASSTMLPQVILAFVGMHMEAIVAADDLSDLVGMGSESVLAKCRQETQSVTDLMRKKNELGLSDILVIAHRFQCRAACLKDAEAQQAEYARMRRQERLQAEEQRQRDAAGELQAAARGSQARQSALGTSVKPEEVPEDEAEGDDGPHPMFATVTCFKEQHGGSPIGATTSPRHRRHDMLSDDGHGMTAYIAVFSGPLVARPKVADQIRVDESVCLGGCLGHGRHHVKCPNYHVAYQLELQLGQWKQNQAGMPGPARLQAVAAIPLAAELPLQGGTERYRGKAVVILRGSVNFITKHDHAKAAGAAAVIFVNLEQDEPFLAYPPVDEASTTRLPSVCVGRTDGDALLAAVQPPISSFESASESEETASMSSISTVSSPSGSAMGGGAEGGAELWLEVIADADQSSVAWWQAKRLAGA